MARKTEARTPAKRFDPFGDKVVKILWGWEPSHGLDAYVRTLDVAVDLGFEAVSFMVSWNNRTFDDHIRYTEEAIKRGLKIAIWPFTHLSIENMRKFKYYGLRDVQMDPQGRPICRDLFTTLSFASPHIHAATDFVAQATAAFRDFQNDGHILYFAPANTRNGEVSFEHAYGGYGAEGSRDIGHPSALADYNPLFIAAFRRWLMEERYGNCTKPLSALNANWGTAYNKPAEIMPPVPLPQFPGMGETAFLQWWRGWEWYAFRHLMLKRFIRECADKIEAAGGWKIPPILGNNVGCYYDQPVAARGCASYDDLLCHPWISVIKDNPMHDYNIEFDASLLVSSARRRNGCSCLEMTNQAHRPDNVKLFTQGCRTAIERGIHSLSFAFLNPLYDGQGAKRVETWRDLHAIQKALARTGHWDAKIRRPRPGGEFTYTESEIIAKLGLTGAGIHTPSTIETRFEAERRLAGGCLDVRIIRDVTLLAE